jgi:hypothetical protein
MFTNKSIVIAGISLCSLIFLISNSKFKATDESTPNEYSEIKTPAETIIPNPQSRVELVPLTAEEYQQQMLQCLNSPSQTINTCQSQINSSKFVVIYPPR